MSNIWDSWLNDTIFAELVLPEKEIITQEDIFGNLDRDTIYHIFFEAIVSITNLSILEFMGSPARIASSTSILYRVLHRRKIREATEKARIQDEIIRTNCEKLATMKKSSLYGQACWRAYKENSANNTLNFGIYYAPGAASRVPNMEQVDYHLRLILEEAVAKGKTIFPDAFLMTEKPKTHE